MKHLETTLVKLLSTTWKPCTSKSDQSEWSFEGVHRRWGHICYATTQKETLVISKGLDKANGSLSPNDGTCLSGIL